MNTEQLRVQLPKHKLFISPAFGETIEQEFYIKGYKQAQQDMLKAKFRQFKEIEVTQRR